MAFPLRKQGAMDCAFKVASLVVKVFYALRVDERAYNRAELIPVERHASLGVNAWP